MYNKYPKIINKRIPRNNIKGFTFVSDLVEYVLVLLNFFSSTGDLHSLEDASNLCWCLDGDLGLTFLGMA